MRTPPILRECGVHAATAPRAKREWSALLLAALLLGAVATSGVANARAGIRSPAPATTPNPGASRNVLNGVSAVSTGDAWAVGYYKSDKAHARTLILHWNGSTWSRVPSPNPSSGQDELSAVSGVSATNAWAVGSTLDNTTGAMGTLILHWNGTSGRRCPVPIRARR